MSDFKAKMRQIVFLLGLRCRPHWGNLKRSPRPLAVFKGPTSKGREGESGGEGKGREREGESSGGEGKGRVGEGKGGESCDQLGSLDPPVQPAKVVRRNEMPFVGRETRVASSNIVLDGASGPPLEGEIYGV